MIGNNGASLLVFCMPRYHVVGNSVAFCNGTHWDRSLGDCHEDNLEPPTSCDFETSELCGWRNDPSNDYNWVRRDGFKSFEHIVSGPSHDHTSGKPLEGFYLVAEEKNQVETERARIISPIFEKKRSENACFRMFYHMYDATVGRLRVYALPDSVDMRYYTEPK